MTKPKIIVLDDDPTGSQTVHSCLLLTRWDLATLRLGLADEAPIFFVLTNTRSLPPDRAASVTREVCRTLKVAIAESDITDFLVVSRSDSTLRGHYPVETDIIAEELGPFDAHFLVPAFFEGGRLTRDSIHYLKTGDTLIPVHETEFARDSVFGYQHSYLPDYAAEKTAGRIAAEQVVRILLADLRTDDRTALDERLRSLTGNSCVAVDGEVQADLDQFAAAILAAASQGKRFLFRSAASLLTSLAQLPPQPIAATDMSAYRRSDRPGVILVGSHVRKTTEQLYTLLQEPDVVGVEVDVTQLLIQPNQDPIDLKANILDRVQTAYQADKTPVIYTSREELTFEDAEIRLQFGVRVSSLLMDLVQHLPPDLSFLISKGGITSNDVLSQGLALPTARLLGQILPGCSVVITPPDHDRFPQLPVVLFPGNVGDAKALATVYHRLSATRSTV